MRPCDWSERLIAVVERHRSAAFEWGSYDCATLVRDVADALGAADPFAGETWDGPLAAARAVRRHHCVSVREFIGRRLLQVAPGLAQRGDLGFTADDAPLMCPAVIVGADAVSRNETGWIVLPRVLLIDCYRLSEG